MQLSIEQQNEILKTATRYFNEGTYERATPLLHSLVSYDLKSPNLYHMLGTIYYEQGKFKQSIQSFRRALIIDPEFTDSSVGLSVILNDLGKYEEAQAVFIDAQKKLKTKTENPNKTPQALIERHWELVEMYKKHNMPREAINQITAIEGLTAVSEHTMREKSSIYRNIKKFDFAIGLLTTWKQDNQGRLQEPSFELLAELYFLNREPLNSLTCCEEALKSFPNNLKILKLYQQLKDSTLDLRGEI